MAASFKYRWLDALFDHKAPWIRSRHLLVASVLVNRWMDPEGNKCFPPAHLVAERTRMSRKSVYRVINDLADRGWLLKVPLRTALAGSPGKGWKVHRLTPLIPDAVDTESTPTPETGPNQADAVDTQSHCSGHPDHLIPSSTPLVNREEVRGDEHKDWLAEYENAEGRT